MVRAKTTVEEPEAEEVRTESEAEAPLTKSDVVDIVKDAVKDLLPGNVSRETSDEIEGDPAKPESPRVEEARSYQKVMDKIKEFEEKFEGKSEEKKEKAEPEKVPASSTVRKIEKWLWGKE